MYDCSVLSLVYLFTNDVSAEAYQLTVKMIMVVSSDTPKNWAKRFCYCVFFRPLLHM